MSGSPRVRWWIRGLNWLLADALFYRRAQGVIASDLLATKECIGKDNHIREVSGQIGMERLNALLDAERERRKSIEEKAKANLVAITIAFTIVMAGPTSLVAQVGLPEALKPVHAPIIAVLTVAALYFAWSGHVALNALLVREWWQLDLGEEAWDKAKRAEHTWWSIRMNQKVTLLRTNALDASYTAMRRGLAALVLLLLPLGGTVRLGAIWNQGSAPQCATPWVVADTASYRGASTLMPIFPGSAWTDLVTAAVACISVAGVWWTFWPGHRERLRERREQRLQRLLGLDLQLQEINFWAGTSYDNSAHDPEWYNASWAVRPFPWDYVENFNRLVVARDYPAALTMALVALEASARRFHDMLAEQTQYLRRAPQDIGERWPAVTVAARAKGGELSHDDLLQVGNLSELDREWFAELYRRNKATHVVGIGDAGSGALHAALGLAATSLVEARLGLQAGRDSNWRWMGHAVAGVFAVLGLLLLSDLGWALVNQHFGKHGRGTVADTHRESSLGNAQPRVMADSLPANSARPRLSSQREKR